MIDDRLRDDEPLLDLLVSRVTQGISSGEETQLAQRLANHADAQPDYFEHAAAAAAVVFCRRDRHRQALPAAVKQRIVSQARALRPANAGADVVFLDQRRDRASDRPARVARRPWLSGAAVGWYAAAALALVLVLPGPRTGQAPATSLAQQRAALLASASDAVTVPWSASEQDGYENVTGDVVWSDSAQAGFLRLAGLPVNEPSVAQYQLWIIDPDRDDVPVDGGVFDVSADGQVLIPITAKLAVDRPTAFALTLEQPGGVVVSEGPLLLIAASESRSG